MKSIKNYLLSGLLVIAASACSNEELMQPEVTPDATGETVTVKAYLPDNGAPLSRVALAEGGTDKAPTLSVSWKDGDKFSVIRNRQNETFTKADGTNEFTGTLPDAEGSGNYLAVYPAKSKLIGQVASVDLSSQAAGGLNPNLTYMYAISADGKTFEFNHLTALLKPSFTGIPSEETVSSVAISSDEPTYKDQDVMNNNTIKRAFDYNISFTALPTYIYLPSMGVGKKLVFIVATNKDTYTATLTTKKAIEAGKLYTTTIALEKSARTDWEPGIVSVQPVGEGTEKNPYLIANAYNLEWLKTVGGYASNAGKFYKQTADLSISGEWKPIATSMNNPFKGIYDGNDMTISGSMEFSSSYGGACGLFSYNAGTIKNLNMDVNITGRTTNNLGCMGTVAGYNQKEGQIINCSNQGTVTGEYNSGSNKSYLGGIVGYNQGTVKGCINEGAVTGVQQGSTSGSHSYAGGIVGYHVSGIVSGCTNTASVNGNGAVALSAAGGIAGMIGSATLDGCTNHGTVTGYSGNYCPSNNCAGGIIGRAYDVQSVFLVLGCINYGQVTGGESQNTGYTSTGGVIGEAGGSSTAFVACANAGMLTVGTKGKNNYCNAFGRGSFNGVALWVAGDEYALSSGIYTLVKNESTDANSTAAISAMNVAIDTYNSTAEEAKKCNYTWEWTGGEWPALKNL